MIFKHLFIVTFVLAILVALLAGYIVGSSKQPVFITKTETITKTIAETVTETAKVTASVTIPPIIQRETTTTTITITQGIATETIVPGTIMIRVGEAVRIGNSEFVVRSVAVSRYVRGVLYQPLTTETLTSSFIPSPFTAYAAMGWFEAPPGFKAVIIAIITWDFSGNKLSSEFSEPILITNTGRSYRPVSPTSLVQIPAWSIYQLMNSIEYGEGLLLYLIPENEYPEKLQTIHQPSQTTIIVKL